MTLLGALHLGGRVLLAADSQVLAQHRPGIFVKEKADKIWRVPQMPDVIWGFSGDTDTGSRFGQWLNAQTASIWDDSCAAATEELARLNGDAHQLAQLAECERERVGVLVAGCPDGVASLSSSFTLTRARPDMSRAPLYSLDLAVISAYRRGGRLRGYCRPKDCTPSSLCVGRWKRPRRHC